MWVIPYSILLLITMFFGSNDLIPIKLGRLIINWVCIIAGAALSQKRKWTGNIVITIWFVSIGLINTYALKISGKELSLTGDPTDLLGSEYTTILYIIFMFLSNNHMYCVFVLTPIYLIINIAMLVTVHD